MKIIAATKNKGKIREISTILAPLGIDVISQVEAGIDVDVEETGSTFAENAQIKAKSVSMLCDMPVVADDSGLCIEALDGAPGVYSARYAGENATDSERINKVLSELDGVLNRKAKFVSAMVMVFPDGRQLTAIGETFGRIAEEPSGEGGFGYDPIFYSDDLLKTFAEASEDEKNSISHRRRALEKLFEMLEKITSEE